MSTIGNRGEQSTSSEITALAALAALSASSTGQFIRKTGTATFENASMSAASLSLATGWVKNGSSVILMNANDKVGVGTSTPTANLTIGAGSNPNVNANINLLVQGVSDARLGVSVGDHGTFMSVGDASTYGGLFAYNYFAGAAMNLSINQFGGGVGIGETAPTAVLHIKAGTATANTAPIKITTGVNLTVAEVGAIEYNNAFYLTNWKTLRYSVGGTLVDHYVDAGNVTTGETDLYSDTLAANTFATNGDKVESQYGGIFVSSASATRQIKFKFAGTTLLDTGALSISTSSSWAVYCLLQRVSATVVRYTVALQTAGASTAVYNATGELTGLTLTGTNIMKLTGQAAGVGAATNDIVAKLGYISFSPAV